MHYRALLTREGDAVLAEFPDCPGCQTFAREGQDILARAKEALEGWLELALEDGEAPPQPAYRGSRGEQTLDVHIEPRLALAIALRWARLAAGWTQAELAARVGVSQQQIAKLERSEANPTLETIQKVAHAFGLRAEVELRPELVSA